MKIWLLVVDDDRSTKRAVLNFRLSKAKTDSRFQQLEIVRKDAYGGQEAKDIIKATFGNNEPHDYDRVVIIMDKNMPGKDGDVVVKEIKEMGLIRDIMWVGYTSDLESRDALKDAGVEVLFDHPVTLQNVLDLYGRILEEHKYSIEERTDGPLAAETGKRKRKKAFDAGEVESALGFPHVVPASQSEIFGRHSCPAFFSIAKRRLGLALLQLIQEKRTILEA